MACHWKSFDQTHMKASAGTLSRMFMEEIRVHLSAYGCLGSHACTSLGRGIFLATLAWCLLGEMMPRMDA